MREETTRRLKRAGALFFVAMAGQALLFQFGVVRRAFDPTVYDCMQAGPAGARMYCDYGFAGPMWTTYLAAESFLILGVAVGSMLAVGYLGGTYVRGRLTATQEVARAD